MHKTWTQIQCLSPPFLVFGVKLDKKVENLQERGPKVYNAPTVLFENQNLKQFAPQLQ